MSRVGVCFASTGGMKLVRAVRSLQRMEPTLFVHAVIAKNTTTFHCRDRASDRILADMPSLRLRHLDRGGDCGGFANSGMNDAISFLRDDGCDVACVFHDDLVFSPLPEHLHSISRWFTEWDSDWAGIASGLSFAHWECLAPSSDMRRAPGEWDSLDLESGSMWRSLDSAPRVYNGSPVAPYLNEFYPDGQDFFVRYEGPGETISKWRRLGPTGLVIPIAQWESLGRFSETDGVFYDEAYSADCFQRGLPPIYAITNVPYLHLHNQTINPWADTAIGVWGNSDAAFERRFGATLRGFWRDDWLQRWKEVSVSA